MALTQIRAQQIAAGTITNAQIASDAGILESKLALNFPTHAVNDPAPLVDKKVSDYVQVNGMEVAGLQEIDLTAGGILLSTVHAIDNGDLAEGVFDGGATPPHANSKGIVRSAVTGEPILAIADDASSEVYCRTVYDAANEKWVLRFFSGQDVAFTFGAGADDVDFQFLQRFNLSTVSELFAANEKFVYGAADITATLNIQQLVADLFTSPYTLNRDGVATLATPLQTVLSDLDTALKSVVADDSGADYIGFSSAVSGLTSATTVRTAIEAALSKAQSDASDALSNFEDALAATTGAGLVGFDNTYSALSPVNSAVAVDTVQAAVEALVGALHSVVEDSTGADFVGYTSSLEAPGAVASSTNVKEAIDALAAELLSLENLLEDAATGGAKYIAYDNSVLNLEVLGDSAVVTNVDQAIAALHELINANGGDLTTEIDNVETSLGSAIAGDGTFVGYSNTNYIDSAISMTDADVLLDEALKTHVDDLAAVGGAAMVGFDPAATNLDPATVTVQAAIAELDQDLATHISEVSEAHMASAIGYVNAVLDVTDVAAALDALESKWHGHYFLEVDATAGQTEIELSVDTADFDIRVALNGQDQREGVSYGYVLSGTKVVMNDELIAGDYVKVEWSNKTA